MVCTNWALQAPALFAVPEGETHLEIRIVCGNKKQFIDLLLLADEQESMIDKYLERGELFALYDGGLKSICVVTRESEDTCELKSIATDKMWQGYGYCSKLLQYVFHYYKDKYETITVGTGDYPPILRFYERHGFRVTHKVENFFTDNYDHPIFENGTQLVDMIYLGRELK